MFDPYDQVKQRTQRLLTSAAHIREERALRTARHEAPPEPATASLPARVTMVPGPVSVARTAMATEPCPPGSSCTGAPAAPGSPRPRAA
jgi:hypothetical protein